MATRRLFPAALGLCALALAGAAAALAAAAAGDEAADGIVKVADWQVEGHFIQDEDMSGLACDGAGTCVAASDETTGVQVFHVKDRRIVADVYVDLLASHGEIDIEGLALAGDYFYAAGSHGASRKKAEIQPNRYKIVRVPVAVAAAVRAAGTGEVDAYGKAEVATLHDFIKSNPTLGPYADVRLQRNGVNIEGLAVKDGKLYAGFRGPSIDGRAAVLVVDEAQLFGGSWPDPVLRQVRLGRGIGIRDLVATADGFLILSGDAGVKQHDGHASRFELGHAARLHLWDGSSEDAIVLGSLRGGSGDAEGLLLLDEDDEGYRVLVVHDGVGGGAPVEYRVSR